MTPGGIGVWKKGYIHTPLLKIGLLARSKHRRVSALESNERSDRSRIENLVVIQMYIGQGFCCVTLP